MSRRGCRRSWPDYSTGFSPLRDVRRIPIRSRPQPALDALAIDDAARNFLDRALGRVELRNAVALEQPLGGAHLELALTERCVAAAGPPAAANLVEPRRLDRETEQLVDVRAQRRR